MQATRQQLGEAETTPTGLTLWRLDSPLSIIWLGPGGGLLLGIHATSLDGQIVPIEHPTASGTFDTRKAAKKAAQAFLDAPEGSA